MKAVRISLSIIALALFAWVALTPPQPYWTDTTKIKFEYHNEFTTGVNADQVGDIFASNTGTGASSGGLAAPSSGNIIGQVQSTTGSTATGRTYVGAFGTAFHLGGGVWSYELNLTGLSNLCSATEGYTLAIGFFDDVAANKTDGVYFLYDSLGTSTGSASSDKWQMVTASNGSRTFSESSVSVSTLGAKLQIVVNADATAVDFFINDSPVRTETATIPSGAGRELAFGWCLLKSVGSTARTANIDYLHVTCDYTTPKN